MHRSLIFLSLATLVLLASSATGQESAIQPYLERERFMLFNACRPMRVIVSLPHADKDSARIFNLMFDIPTFQRP